MTTNYANILKCIKTKAVAAVGGAATDCADLALQSLAECCEVDNVKLSMEVYDSATRVYIRLKRSAYSSLEAYIKDLKLKMGATSLYDRDKITKKKPLAGLVPGEIILYHLPGNADYTGHTMIVTVNNTAAKKITVTEGHIGDGSPTEKSYTYAEIRSKFDEKPNSEFMGGRKWNWGNIDTGT